jgi:exonuclease SbcC
VRPARLELQGFTAFRDRTVVDFDGVDLFAFTGPTGSGKSSLVDAMCFALYGCVPRYDDRRLVAPVISQNANEARVRLDFTVGGVPYTAVRVVRRTRAGASTKEARLEGAGSTVLAGNEKELGQAVESLLGLAYEHFVKCVVLPQGEFAQFLHDKPERRQELLVGLLDLDVYGRMGQSARRRADAARAAVGVHETRLADLAFATVDARKEAEETVAALTELRADADAIMRRVSELAMLATAERADADAAIARAAALRGVEVPDGVDELVTAVAAAQAEAEDAEAADAAATAAVEGAEAVVGALPAVQALENTRDLYERGERLAAAWSEADAALAQRRTRESTLREAAAAADAQLVAAADALERAQAAHRAHAVVADLVVGKPCPVCQHVVRALPDTVPPAALERARTGRREAEVAAKRAAAAVTEAESERVRDEATLAALGQQRADVDIALERAPAADELDALLARVRAAHEAFAAARDAEKVVRRRRAAAEAVLRAATERRAQARREFDSARDRVAALDPPPRRDDGDLAADWSALATWAATEASRAAAASTAAAARAEELAVERDAVLGGLGERCAALGVDVVAAGGGTLRDAVGDALARAEADLDRIGAALAEADNVRAQVDALSAARAVAEGLGRHLGARGFEKWILDEALGVLVDGATSILLDLTAGQYSLGLDTKTSNFMVIDHRNADEPRPARTLSGGETFLASLALALALADRISLFASTAPARLESIFLDEGFGTLDADTLDTVASAIEELGAQGRMVGLISHVAELAERVPVRYEVSKVGNASTVRRVDA